MKSLFISITLAICAFAPAISHAQVPDQKTQDAKIAEMRAAATPPKIDPNDSKLDVEVSADVLKTAEWANFDYMGNVRNARAGDHHSLRNLLEFSGTVDGAEGIQHAVTCLELILPVNDESTALTIVTMKPKLKALLLERFLLAQARTKKEPLRLPMYQWAPLTWDAINGRKVAATCLHQGTLGPMPKSDKTGLPASVNTPASTENDKQ